MVSAVALELVIMVWTAARYSEAGVGSSQPWRAHSLAYIFPSSTEHFSPFTYMRAVSAKL